MGTAVVMMALLVGLAWRVSGQTWIPTSAPLLEWLSVASSADGTRLVAGTWEGPIYVSTNSGTTWTPTSPPGAGWNSVACSADGTTLIAAGYLTPICLSTNFGVTWTATAFINGFNGVAMSADGTKLIAVAFDFYWKSAIYVSTNSGDTWTTYSQDNLQHPDWPLWIGAAASADGNTMIVASQQMVCISTNSGTTWATNSLSDIFQIACSADASHIIAGGWNGVIHISTNSGATWSSETNLFNGAAGRVACSANGGKILAVAGGHQIYLSSDFGASWIEASAPTKIWSSVACSADGSKMVAGEYDLSSYKGLVYTAQTTPTSWLEITPSEGNLVLSWTVPSMPFVLQQNSDLSTTNWTDVTTVPTLNYVNLKYQVTIPAPLGMSFYRLVSR